MPTAERTLRPKPRTSDKVEYTFDRNGALVVDSYSLLMNTKFRAQFRAATELGRLQESLKKTQEK